MEALLPALPGPNPGQRRRVRTWIVALSALALLVSAVVPAGATNPEQDRIARTRAELASVRQELEDAREEHEGHEIALADADRQLRAVFEAVDTAQQAVERQQQAVADAEDSLDQAQEMLAEQRALMAQRVGSMYRRATPSPVLAVFDAETVADAVRQSAYMTAIGRQDRAAVEGLANAESHVEAETRALAAEQVAMDAVLQEQRALLEDVEEIRNDRALIAAASQELVAQLESREAHLDAEAAQLTALAQRQAAADAAALAAANRPQASASTDNDDEDAEDEGEEAGEEPVAAAPPAPGGGFSWPAGGTVTSGFGARWGRNHDGIDIAGGAGSPVSAAKGGTVIQAGQFGGYGNFVAIAHGNGFVTAYAHLESIAVSNGQSVGTGTYLGGMGCTGSCTGTHLHFEIRVNGTPVDPMQYL